MIEHPYTIKARQIAEREFNGDLRRAFGFTAREHPNLFGDFLRTQGLDDAGVQAVAKVWIMDPSEHAFVKEAMAMAAAQYQGDFAQASVALARGKPKLYDSYRQSLNGGNAEATPLVAANAGMEAHTHPFYTEARALAEAEYKGDFVKASEVLATRNPKLYDDYKEFLHTGKTQEKAAAKADPGPVLLVSAKDVLLCRGGFQMAPIVG